MWWSILKRSSGSMSNSSKKLVDEVIDETPRSVNEILDLMYDKVEEKRKIKSGPNKKPGSGKILIPTRGELHKYLGDNYNKVYISKRTGKEINSHRGAETRYFR